MTAPTPSRERALITVWRMAIATLILETVAQTFVASGPILFVFFTNDSNLVAAAVLLWACRDWRSERPVTAWLRGAGLLYVSITALVDQVILHGGLGGLVLHIVTPLAVLADWVLLPPRHPVSGRMSMLWLSFPVLYLGGAMTYGAATGGFPYGFLNPNVVGTSGVAMFVGIIAVIVLLLARLVRALGLRGARSAQVAG